MIKPSTFSIVAYDPTAEAFGIAVASKFLAVGAVVPWLSLTAGAVATQSYANLLFGTEGLQHLANNSTAEEAFNLIASKDKDLQTRQVGIVDRSGNSFSFTGSACHDWAGGVTGPGYAIQGNILTSERVVKDMESAYLSTTGDLSDRLFAALAAGDAAGGDKRGRQSAALKVLKSGAGYAGGNDVWIDFRVDNDPDPIRKLHEMIELHKLYFGNSEPGDKIEVDTEFIAAITPILVKKGFLTRDDVDNEKFMVALENFIGVENFEDRFDYVRKTLDKPVFEYIVKNY